MAYNFMRMVSLNAKFKKSNVKYNHKNTKEDNSITDSEGKKHIDFFANAKSSTSEDQEIKDIHDKELNEDSDIEEEHISNSAEEVKVADKAASALRKMHKIHVKGNDVPAPCVTFEALMGTSKLAKLISQNMKAPVPDGLGCSVPTPIQMQSIPILLQGRDILACAPTGSGKTASFVIPLLLSLKKPAKEGFRAIIVSPTRELAQQIFRQITIISQGRNFRTLLMSKSNANVDMLGPNSSKKRDILVTTPLRLVNSISQIGINLSNVEYLILDEADRLFDLGFLEQVDQVMAAVSNPKRKIAMFSATMAQGVEELARTVLRDPIRVVIGSRNQAADLVSQKLVFVGQENGKLIALRDIVREGLNLPVLIFVQSKKRATDLFKELVYDRINVEVIHSDKTKAQRDAIVTQFRSGKIWALICTDLMARGMDFKCVNCVINYDFPQSTASYIHRIGRTGRAGRKGEAITFYTEDDRPLLGTIAHVMELSGSEIPAWMKALPKIHNKSGLKLKQHAPTRRGISTTLKEDLPDKKKKKKRKVEETSTPSSDKVEEQGKKKMKRTKESN